MDFQGAIMTADNFSYMVMLPAEGGLCLALRSGGWIKLVVMNVKDGKPRFKLERGNPNMMMAKGFVHASVRT